MATLMVKGRMAPTGFEPATPGLKVQCSDQAELRSHLWFGDCEAT